ncbi:MAG: gliding motility-associated C-terminal domain-containing protein [Bacteroidia bacterium]
MFLFCNTANTPSTGIGTWSVISGSAVFNDENNPVTSVSGLSQGANVLLSISNGVVLASTDDVTINVDQQVTAPDAGQDQSVCSSTATLTALAGTGGTWSLVSGSGTIATPGNATTTVSGLAAGANVFRWTVSGGSCGTASDDVTITRFAMPTTANAGSDQSVCSSSAILAANTPSTGIGTWSVISGSAVFNDENNPVTSVSGLSQGANVLRWSISNGVCPASTDDVTINVDQQVTAPDAGPNQSVCSSTATLTALAGTGGTWSLVSGSGTIATPGNVNTTVTGLSTGANVFRWTVSGGSCGTASDDVTVTRFGLPTNASAGSDQTICATSSVLAANTPVIGSGLWSVVSGSAVFNDESDPLTQISGLSEGENILQWTISNGACPASTDQLSITVELPADPPNAGTDQTICSTSATLNATSGAGGTWSLVGGSGTIASPGSATSNVSGLATGTNVFRWTVSGGACGNSFDEVSIIVQAPPSISNAGSDQSVCGSSATLSANVPGVGTGTWTLLSGAGTITNAGSAVTTVTGLSGGQNVFRWLISNGVCTPSADEVTITAQLDVPDANAGNDQSVCSSATTLAADAATGGFWTVVSGTGQLSNASLFNSGVTGMSAGLNVFRWNVPAGACGTITDDVQITVQTLPTLANAGSDQNICSTIASLQANSPLSGTGLWSVVQGSGIFSNASDPFTSVSGLQAGTNILRWTISNGVCPPSADDVIIIVDSNPVTPSAGADQQVCSSSATLSASPTGGTWSVITGSAVFGNANSATTSVSGLSAGQNRLRWTVSAGACGTVFDDVIITVSVPPSTALAGADQEICATFTSLSAVVPLSGTGQWTVIAGSGVFENATSAITTVSGLSAGINTFRWTVSSGACPPSADDITVTVQENPLSPEAGPNQTICASSTQLAATPFPGGSWSLVSGAGTVVTPSSASSSVTGLGAGANVFRWTIPGGACDDVSDQVTITVQASPTVSNAGPDQQICATVTQLAGNTPMVGTGTWTVVSGSGTFSNANSASTTVSGLSTGTNVFRWTITNGVCPPSADNVTVTVDNNPLSPEAGPNQTICATSTQLAATAAPGGQWTLVSGSGTITSATQANTTVTALGTGANVFRWTIPGGTCGSVSDQVTITVDAPPTTASAGNNQTICITSNGVSLAANQPITGSGIWSVVSGSGTFTNTADPAAFVSGLSTGNNVFQWTISNGVCPASSAQVVIQVDPLAIPPNAGSDQTICSAGTQLSATPAAGATWSLVSGTATITSASLASTTVSGLSPGTIVLQWSVPGGACPGASDQMSITVQAPPTTASAGADQEICSTTANLQANTPTTGTGFWTLVSGSGVFADPTAASTQVSGLSPGNNTFRWSISNGVCAPSSDDVTVVVQDNPVSPSAGADQTICTNSTQLNATADPDGSWSLVSGSGTIVNSGLANTTVNGLGIGANVFRWTISGGSCPDASDNVVITVQQPPTAANAGPDQTICLEGTQLAANIPVTGTGTWSLVSGSGTFADAQLATTAVSGLSAGTNIFRWTISNGVCTPSADEVSIIVQELGTAPNAGPDQVICGSTAIMAASPSGGNWSLISGSGTFQNAQSATTSISGLSTGSNVFRWTVQNGVCPALSDDVTILVQTAPSTAAAGPDQSVCSSSATLAANVPLSGSGLWTVVSGTGFFSNATQANSNVSGMSPGLNVFRWTISNGNCPPSFDEVSITVLSAPSAFAGQDQNICGSTTVMTASAPQAGVGTWTVISGTANFSDAQSASSAVGGLSTGINVLRWTVVNGSCPPAFDEVTIQCFAAPVQPEAGDDQSICSTTAQLNASEPVNGQGIWSVVSGAGLIADPESASTSVSNLQTGINVFRFTVSNGICATVSDEVSIEVLSQPAANAGADQSVCAGSATLNASLASGASGQWQLISGSAVIQNTASPGSLVSNLGIGQNIFQWTVSNGTCPPQSDQVIVTRFEEPSVANAGNDFQTCATGATLSANTPTVGTGFWSVVSGNGNFSNPTNPLTAVSQLAIGDNILQWTISNGSCPPQSDQVIVTVDQNPTSADAGPDQGICSDNTTMAATAPVAGEGEWTVVNGSATITSPADPNTGITAISAGTATLRWTVTNGSCVSFDEVEIIRYLPPSEADAGVDRQLCSDTVHLHANIPSVGDGFWSVVSGTASIQNPVSPDAIVTALSAGANVFVWTITNGSCTSATDQVTVIRQEAPDAANAGPDQQVCDTEAILAANLPQVGTGIWSVVSGNGEIDDAFSPTSSVTNLSAGENIFRWTTLNGICPASTDQISIFRALPPSPAVAGTDVEICGNTASLDAEAPETGAGTWSLISGTAVIADENDPQTGLNGILPGTITLVWQVSNSPCQAETDTVQLFAATQPPQAFAGSNIQTCETSVLLVGSNTGGGTPNWQLLSGSATISNPGGQITSVTGIEPGQNQLEYSVSNAHCVSRDTILITRFISEPFVYAGPDSTICSNEIVLQGSEAEFGNGVWTLLSGSAVLSNPNVENATLGFITDTVQLSWTVSNGVCPAVADTVLLIMTQPDEIATAMDDGTFCANEIQITATPPIAGTAWWNLISGDAVVEDSTQAITTVTPQDFGEIVLEWILVDGSCRTADTVTITANEAPFPVYAGEDQQLCGTNTILDATEPELGTGIWSTLAGGFFSDATDPKSGFITPNSGYRALVWNVSLGPCTLRDTVFIDMIEVPVANAGPDLIGCGGDTLALQAGNPVFGDGLWTLLSAGATVLEPDFQNSDFIAENPGNYYLIWKVSNDICADSAILTITILESDDPSCIGSSDEVFIPEGFSPNGDGVFDQFVIQHNPDKKLELQVYDRRGELLYKSEDYQNDWDGTSTEGTILIDGKLPEGTYFYLVKVQDEPEYRKGYFTLWR